MSDSEEEHISDENEDAVAVGGDYEESESEEPEWKQPIPKGTILSLQDYCTRSLSSHWAELPDATRTALCSDGTVPESVQRRFTKLIAQERAKEILDSLLPQSGLFGKENPAERLVLMNAITKKMVNWKHQEVLRSNFYRWYNSMAEYLDMDENTRIKGPDDPNLEALDWREKIKWCAFPRPFCTSPVQLEQLQDIIDRVKIVSHSNSSAQIGKNSSSQIETVFTIAVRKPSRQTVEQIQRTLGSDPHGTTWARLLHLDGPGQILLTYTYQFSSPHYGDCSTVISLKFGKEMYDRVQLFHLDDGDVGEEFEPRLLGLKQRLLDGTTQGNDANSSITNHHFMSLLLMCALGDNADGWHHLSTFAGYFEDDHRDDYYT